jgi:pimeloyl-ACP methyl ester carboxylesterase
MNATFETVTSADGTPIAVERKGGGPPVILIGGAFNDRSAVAGLAAAQPPDFTAVTYDRRGRGDSGDSANYAVEREIEDLAAVIAQTGGTAGVFGHSSGAVLALEAAQRGVGIGKLAAYEPTYVIEGTRPRLSRSKIGFGW